MKRGVKLRYVDLDKWERKSHFEFFYRMDYPQFNICMNLDVTNLVKFVKDNNISFYYAMIFASTQTVNKSFDFKLRIRDGKVVIHDIIHPSFTDMSKDDELFKMVTVEMKGNILEFSKYAEEQSKSQNDYFCFEKLEGRDDLIYYTCIPWISFTHLSHTITINKNDSVPKISWGKYFNDGDKILLPFSVQVNHALMDGLQVGRYVEDLQNYINCL